MAIVVRLGPLPLGRRRASRVAELERILATVVGFIEVTDVARLAGAVAGRDVAAVALDAPLRRTSPTPPLPPAAGRY